MTGEIYQFVLAAVYHADGLWGEATFDLFPRAGQAGGRAGDPAGQWVVAGVEEAVAGFSGAQIPEERIAELQAHPVFAQIRPGFFEHLRRLRLEGEIRSVPEGTVVQERTPFLQITAPLGVCTLAETLLLQPLAAGMRAATAAARLSAAAGGRTIYDFSSRFWPDPAAALLGARAAWIGGAAATSAAGAGRYGIPLMGTMPTSFLAAYGDDRLAMKAFRRHFPMLCHLAAPEADEADGPAAEAAAQAALRALAAQAGLQSLRVEDPDMEAEARRLRARLDAAGLPSVRLLGSGGLDEARVRRIAEAGVPLDWLAIGRALAEAPDPRIGYRIAEMQRGVSTEPVTREGGSLWPGRKQIWRQGDQDVLAGEQEGQRTGASPLLSSWQGADLRDAAIRQRTLEARARRAQEWGQPRRLSVSERLRGR